MTTQRPWIQRAAVAALAIALCGIWLSQFTGAEVSKDSGDTLAMAINLQHHGVISLAEAPPYKPSMYREPVPVFSEAITIAVSDALLGKARFEDYFSGERVKVIKIQNIAWLLVLCASTFFAIRMLTSSVFFGLLGVLLLQLPLPFVRSGFDGLGVDTLDTDLPGAALLALGSLFLLRAFANRRLWDYAIAGASFGLLALTKAAFLYVMAVVIVVLLAASLLGQWRAQWRAHVLGVAVLTVALSAVVVPWMYRNLEQLGFFQISQRGGMVLNVRAVKDGMTAEEYRGAFYVWAPARLQPVLGAALGFSPRDLNRGGRLQRLNRLPSSDFYQDDLVAERSGHPEKAVSFYRTARAELVKLRMEMENAGSATPSAAADEVLKARAERRILDHPVKHLLVTVPFLWRGALLQFPVLAVALIYALRRRQDLALYILPGCGLIAFYALLSHFIPRYSVPALPIFVTACVVLLQAMWQWTASRARRDSPR